MKNNTSLKNIVHTQKIKVSKYSDMNTVDQMLISLGLHVIIAKDVKELFAAANRIRTAYKI